MTLLADRHHHSCQLHQAIYSQMRLTRFTRPTVLMSRQWIIILFIVRAVVLSTNLAVPFNSLCPSVIFLDLLRSNGVVHTVLAL